MKKEYKILTAITLTLILLTTLCVGRPGEQGIGIQKINYDEWDMHIYTTAEVGGKTYYCVIGETETASDGMDEYDVPQPPLEPPGRAFIYITTEFPNPHNRLWHEYKHYPSQYQVFNISVFWFPQDYISPSQITITWDDPECLHMTMHDEYGNFCRMRNGAEMVIYLDAFEYRTLIVGCINAPTNTK